MPSPTPQESDRPRDGSPKADRSEKPNRFENSPPRRRDNSPRRSRSRSRSPPRGPKAKSFSGLKWKKQERRDDEGDDDRRYRDRSGAGDARSRFGRDDRNDSRRGGGRFDSDRGRDARGYGRDDRDRSDRHDRDRGNDRRGGRFDSDRRDGGGREERDNRRPRTEKEKEKPKAAPAPQGPPGEQMIIVTVNDRLGTKAQIPCLASDPIKVFKAMVAARIGRAPHEIMIKRQGERPMKDQLTLEDYGVSNGVQLDLELDTGD